MATNKARLQQNNTDLRAIEDIIEGLPNQPTTTIDGVVQKENLALRSMITSFLGTSLPYDIDIGSAVVLNNEIHILGGNGGDQNHYKFNGTSWTKVSTLPYTFYGGSAVVLNNEIHILSGSTNTYKQNHYKFNGTSWTKVSTLPDVTSFHSSVVILSNTLYIFAIPSSSSDRYLYKFNGTSWTKLDKSVLSFFGSGSALIAYQNEIHILGGSGTLSSHYKFNGASWTKVSTLPYEFRECVAVVLNDEIHIMGSGVNGYAIVPSPKHYKFNGSSWTELNNLPINITGSNAVLVLDDTIHILSDIQHWYVDNAIFLKQ